MKFLHTSERCQKERKISMRLYTIASGSSGNCVCVETDNTCILVDAGVSAKRIEEGLSAQGIALSRLDAILVTHEHIDHVRGIEVITKKHPVPVYGTKESLLGFAGTLKQAERLERLFCFVNPGESFLINNIEVNTFSTSHDAGNPIGYVLVSDGHKIGMATDLGCYNDTVIEKLSFSKLLYLEANYDLNMLMAGSYPYQLKLRIAGKKGHLSNEMSADLIVKLLHPYLQHIVIAHMSKENNYAELAYETVRQAVNNNWRWDTAPPQVTVANRDIPTQPIDTE